jgi:DMSO/TMAO reductase YedYZ heme-binding membrane subunit
VLALGSYFYINLTSALFILVSAGVPMLLSLQLTGKIKQLTLILAGFILIHGSYHIAVILGYQFIGAGILDNVSIVVLIIFGVLYLRLLRLNVKSKNKVRKS